jgi:hypothetical protein
MHREESPSFVALESDPELRERLLEAHRKFLLGFHSEWGASRARAFANYAAQGWLSALAWRPPSPRSRGLLFVQRSAAGLRIRGIWFEPPGSSSLRELLSDLERERPEPVEVVTDLIPGVSPAEQAAFFESRGFWHRKNVLMRREGGPLTVPVPQNPEVRSIRPGDLPEVVEVYERAYRERPGEWWESEPPNSRDDAEASVLCFATPAGAWTPIFLPEASFVWESAGRIRGAVLLDRERPSSPTSSSTRATTDAGSVGRCSDARSRPSSRPDSRG